MLLLRGRFWRSEWTRIRKSGLIVSVAYDVTHRDGVEHAGCTEAGAAALRWGRRASRCGRVRTTITWMGWITYLLRGVPRWESSRCLRTLRCRKANMEPGRCDVRAVRRRKGQTC
jgi:hypothetical protein